MQIHCASEKVEANLQKLEARKAYRKAEVIDSEKVYKDSEEAKLHGIWKLKEIQILLSKQKINESTTYR